MTLDLRRGALLAKSGLLKAPGVGIRLHTLRLVSISERAVGLQLIQLKVEDGEVEVTLEASFEGINLGLVSERLDQDLGVWRTQRSGKSVAMATASSLQVDGHDLPATAVDQLKWSWSWKSRAGQIVVFRAHCRRGAERHPGSGTWQRGARASLMLHATSAGAACWRNTRRPGQAAGSAATSRSTATPPHSKRYGSLSTI